jgi:hypothetical protein
MAESIRNAPKARANSPIANTIISESLRHTRLDKVHVSPVNSEHETDENQPALEVLRKTHNSDTLLEIERLERDSAQHPKGNESSENNESRINHRCLKHHRV